MAYTIKIGQFAKNIESTAQPNTTGWAEHSVTLKNGADISNPRIELQVSWEDIKDVNYAVMMNRYYWVIGKNMLRENLCQLSLRVDVLATYKTEIGASSLYILRSSAASDGTIRDNLYPSRGIAEYSRQAWPATPTTHTFASGVYVLNITGTYTSGSSNLIQLTPPNFRKLLRMLYADIDGFQASDIIQKLCNFFGGNPAKLVNSAMWFPSKFTSVEAMSDTYIGSWRPGAAINIASDPIPCEIIKDPIQFVDYCTFTIDKHPKAATRGEYLNLSPFSNYKLFIPTAGAVNLDTTQLMGITSIEVDRYVDALTGRMVSYVSTPSSGVGVDPHYLAVLTGQYGIYLPLSGGNNTGGQIIGGTLSTIGAAAAAAMTGGTAAMGSSAIIGALNAAIGTVDAAMAGASVSSGGAAGSLVELNKEIILDTTFYDVVDEDNTRNGRPLCQVTTPANLGGFMIADKGDVVMAGPLPEHEEVKRYLETGFFYE